MLSHDEPKKVGGFVVTRGLNHPSHFRSRMRSLLLMGLTAYVVSSIVVWWICSRDPSLGSNLFLIALLTREHLCEGC